jgi:hypothetical protein
VTVESLRDLRELFRRLRRVTVSVFAAHRAVWGVGYRDRCSPYECRPSSLVRWAYR